LARFSVGPNGALKLVDLVILFIQGIIAKIAGPYKILAAKNLGSKNI
jgi:hypothetical protein